MGSTNFTLIDKSGLNMEIIPNPTLHLWHKNTFFSHFQNKLHFLLGSAVSKKTKHNRDKHCKDKFHN